MWWHTTHQRVSLGVAWPLVVEYGALRGDWLRASGIARRRTEEERAEAFYLCERRRRRRIQKRDARAAKKGA